MKEFQWGKMATREGSTCVTIYNPMNLNLLRNRFVWNTDGL